MALVTYKSSAGSGKTSTLVIEYLAIALKKPNQFGQIIALTFTKKATAEMKDRLIEYLIVLKEMDTVHPNSSIDYVVKAIADKTSFNNNEIKQRSKILLTNILHNYGDFGFSTIDSFVVKIVRSFAHDLQLSSNFEIELDSSILIDEAIKRLNELIGINEEITDFLIEFTIEKLDNEESPNLDKPLSELGRLIFDSKHYKNIDSLKSIPLKNFVEIKNTLLSTNKNYGKIIKSFGKQGLKCLSDNNINKNDCSRAWLWGYFNKLLTNNDQIYKLDKLESKTFIEYIDDNKNWYKKNQTSDIISNIEQAQSELISIINKAREYYKKELPLYNANRLILQKVTPLALIHQLKQLIESNYEENDIIHLSEVNRKISEVVNEQHAPFIYERIGQRYNHFLIDEFQDTSVIQWNNMLPLIDNSLASNYRNLLVGDTKQSIYRWRDGEVEQFANLPNLLGDDKSIITEQREALLKSMYEEIILNYNYRSKENIVNFNNHLFSQLLQDDEEYVKIFFQDHIQKTRKETNSGVVVLQNIPKSNDEDIAYENLIEQIINNIKELTINQNYKHGDICIIARKNKFLSIIANKLIENNIKVFSSEALFLKSSRIINVIISFMKLMIDNNLEINSYFLQYYFNDIHNKNILINKYSTKEEFINHINQFGYNFNASEMENMDAYEISEYIISKIDTINTSNPFIYNFLDRIIDLSKKKGASISQIIDYWEEKGADLKIDLASDEESVQLLTIHKSKGLEFPVVIFPLIKIDAKLEGRDMLWVESTENIKDKLPKTLIGDNNYGLESIYKEVLKTELDKKKLDAMNMVYVACTRPTEQLQVIFSSDKESQKYWQACNSIIWDNNRLETKEENYIQLGKTTYNIQETKKNNYDISIDKFISNNWKNRIKLQKDISTNQEIRDKGTQLHNLLSEVYTNTNINELIKKQIKNKQINKEYAKEFGKIINELLIKPETSKFFDVNNTILNEKEIITQYNKVLRPDKIILETGKIIVIDYKHTDFNKISKLEIQKYNNQIQNYQQILNEIYHIPVVGIILFLSPIKLLIV